MTFGEFDIEIRNKSVNIIIATNLKKWEKLIP